MRHEPSRRIDQPEPGFFKLRLVRRGPWVAAKIVFDGKLWGAEIGGRPAGPPHADHDVAGNVMRIWTAGTRITADEYVYLIDVARHAAANPEHPSADPRRPIDINAVAPLF